MLRHLASRSIYHFFNILCLLHNRNKNNIRKLGFVPIHIVMQYIQYAEIYYDVVSHYTILSLQPKTIYEEEFYIDCDSITGITLKFARDPIKCLQLVANEPDPNDKSNKRYHMCPGFFQNTVNSGHVKCLDFGVKNSCIIDPKYICYLCIKNELNNYFYSMCEMHHFSLTDYFYIMLCAVWHNNVPCISFLYNTRRCTITFNNVMLSITNVQTFKYVFHTYFARTTQSQFGEMTLIFRKAIEGGYLDTLKYLHKSGHQYSRDLVPHENCKDYYYTVMCGMKLK